MRAIFRVRSWVEWATFFVASGAELVVCSWQLVKAKHGARTAFGRLVFISDFAVLAVIGARGGAPSREPRAIRFFLVFCTTISVKRFCRRKFFSITGCEDTALPEASPYLRPSGSLASGSAFNALGVPLRSLKGVFSNFASAT